MKVYNLLAIFLLFSVLYSINVCAGTAYTNNSLIDGSTSGIIQFSQSNLTHFYASENNLWNDGNLNTFNLTNYDETRYISFRANQFSLYNINIKFRLNSTGENNQTITVNVSNNNLTNNCIGNNTLNLSIRTRIALAGEYTGSPASVLELFCNNRLLYVNYSLLDRNYELYDINITTNDSIRYNYYLIPALLNITTSRFNITTYSNSSFICTGDCYFTYYDYNYSTYATSAPETDDIVYLNYSYIITNNSYMFKGNGDFAASDYQYFDYTTNTYLDIPRDSGVSNGDSVNCPTYNWTATLPSSSRYNSGGLSIKITIYTGNGFGVGCKGNRFFYDHELNAPVVFNNSQRLNISLNSTQIFFSTLFNHNNQTKLSLTPFINNYKENCVNNLCIFPITYISNSTGNLQFYDMLIEGEEYIKPNLTILSPNSTFDNFTYIPLNFSVIDNYQLDKCWYNITIGATLDTDNTYINCYTNTTITVNFGDGNYKINVCANDTSGNKNCSEKSFTTINYIPVPTIIIGGGGGSSLLIQALNFSVKSTSFGNKIDLALAKNSVKDVETSIVLINTNINPIRVKLYCDDGNYKNNTIKICDYVSFPEETLELDPNEVTNTYTTFIMRIPLNASYGDLYNFNILAVEEGGLSSTQYSKLSVTARFPIWAIVLKWSYVPLQDPNKEIPLAYPVFFISVIASIIVLVFIILILKNILPATSIILGLLAAIATLITLLIIL